MDRHAGPCQTRRRIIPVSRTAALSLTAALLLILTSIMIACGGQTVTTEPGGSSEVLSVEQALKVDQGKTVRVEGALVATETKVVLASALLESYPPQAGGATLAVEGLDLGGVVGLSSTRNQPDLAQVSWTDYPIVLEGVMEDGALQVAEAPAYVEATAGQVRVRFCPPVEPPAFGDTVWWVFDVTNVGSGPLELTFASGQTGEVVLSKDGVEKYRWSEGKAFTQAITTTTLESGQTVSCVFNDTLSVPAGDYEVTATVTASVGPEGAASPLPPIQATLTVR